MCTSSIIGGTVAAISGKKNDREAETRRKNIVNTNQKRVAVRSAKISSRKKSAIKSFSSNVATGGQNRAANKGS
jgi:hypothetical protein